MAKIAIPAYFNAIKFINKEWKGVMLLSLKTYLLIMLFQILANIPVHIIMNPPALLKSQTNPMAFGDILTSLIVMDIFTFIIGFFLSQWLVSPLYISLSRSVVLRKPFDRILCKHLTEKRTLRVAKLLWLSIIVMIPFYVGIVVLAMFSSQIAQSFFSLHPGLIIAFVLTFCAYVIFFIYIMMRIYYLIPVLACDRQFSSVSEIWKHSKGRAWSVFKIMLLSTLLSLGFIILLFVTFKLLQVIMIFIAQFVTVGNLALLIMTVTLITFMGLLLFAVFVLIIPQLNTAAIASIYKLSQSKT